MGPDAMGPDAMGRDAMGRDAMGRDTTNTNEGRRLAARNERLVRALIRFPRGDRLEVDWPAWHIVRWPSEGQGVVFKAGATAAGGSRQARRERQDAPRRLGVHEAGGGGGVGERAEEETDTARENARQSDHPVAATMDQARDSETQVSAPPGGPPRAPLAFRVGVVGHRPERLREGDLDQLARTVKAILEVVKEEVFAAGREEGAPFDTSRRVLRAVSPLAEGADRIFAEQALGLGYELCCVLPFPRAEFERDFSPDDTTESDESESLTQFRGLLDRAVCRFELDGVREAARTAYGAAGRVVLNQSDLLLVVWDGDRLGKLGGTEETLDEARRQGVPVVWVDACVPHAWQMLDPVSGAPRSAAGARATPSVTEDRGALRECVRAAISVPRPAPRKAAKAGRKGHEFSDSPAAGLRQFYAEHQPGWTVAVVWKAFRDVVADGRVPRVKFSVPPFEQDAKSEWPDDRTSATARIVDGLRMFHAWPDRLAVIYADRYRSAFITAFLLAAFAVGMALLPLGAGLSAHHMPETVCIVCELLAILIILGLVSRGRRLRWHERWIDYRLTAELVRQLRLVAPLGGARPFPQIPAHLATYGQPSSTWMAWYVRAVERGLALPSVVVNRDYLRNCLRQLSEVVGTASADGAPRGGQLEYHEVTARRCRLIEKRLHRLGITLLWLTLASCVLHLVPGVWHAASPPEWVAPILTFVCGFFPALGAGLAGIINQGEFRRIENRSESMCGQLRLLHERIEKLRQRIDKSPSESAEQFSLPATALASDAARLLLNEILDWRVVFLDRPLHPPG